MAGVEDESNPRQSSKPKSRRRWPWLGLLVLAPAFVVIAWLEPDEEDLFELCSTQGRPTIYRSVEAEGYYDGATDDCWGCWNYLANTDYKFIEFSISRQAPGGRSHHRTGSLPRQPHSGWFAPVP